MLRRVILALVLACTSLPALELQCNDYNVTITDYSLMVTAFNTTYTLPLVSASPVVQVFGWPGTFTLSRLSDLNLILLDHTGVVSNTSKMFFCKELP